MSSLPKWQLNWVLETVELPDEGKETRQRRLDGKALKEKYLAEGWEPFAVTSEPSAGVWTHAHKIWFRKLTHDEEPDD